MRRYLYLFTLLFVFTNVKAQTPSGIVTIDSFEVIPSNPTKFDTIKVAVTASIAGASNAHGIFSFFVADSFNIEGCYNPNGSATRTWWSDTLTMGILTDTLYFVNFTAYVAYPDCTHKGDSVKATKIIRLRPDPYIDSITILPDSPTYEDEVRVALAVSTGRPGKKISLGYTQTGGHYEFIGCYAWTDSMRVPEYYLDTFNLGRLQQGNYTIGCTAYLGDDTTNCGNHIDSSIKGTSFTVLPPASVKDMPLNELIIIYPNPSKDIIHIESKGIYIEAAQLQDMQGKLLGKYIKPETIDISALPKGLYMLRFDTDRGKTIHKIIRQ